MKLQRVREKGAVHYDDPMEVQDNDGELKLLRLRERGVPERLVGIREGIWVDTLDFIADGGAGNYDEDELLA